MEEISDLKKIIEELRVENASLKATIASLEEGQSQEGTSIWEKKHQVGFSTPVDSHWSEPALLTELEKKGMRKETYFILKSDCYRSSAGPTPTRRFIDFDGTGSDYMDKYSGVYTLPVTGKYRFGVQGRFRGIGTMEWFLCCDGDDFDLNDRRPIYFDNGDEYPSREKEKRVSLFTLTSSSDDNEGDPDYVESKKSVGLYGPENMNVWVECCHKDAPEDSWSFLFCRFSGSYLG